MGELDFTGKTVLVVGGSSGIGNGIAHGFRERGAQVHVWGTRADAGAYAGVEGSDLSGLTYAKVDVGAALLDGHDEPLHSPDVEQQTFAHAGFVRRGRAGRYSGGSAGRDPGSGPCRRRGCRCAGR